MTPTPAQPGGRSAVSGPWREPAEETTGLFPGLVVHDGRMTGSITLGPIRTPLWGALYDYIHSDEEVFVDLWAPACEYDDIGSFLHYLMEMRGEFARLLLMLADAERRESPFGKAWWEKKKDRRRLAAQLRRCLAVVEEEADS